MTYIQKLQEWTDDEQQVIKKLIESENAGGMRELFFAKAAGVMDGMAPQLRKKGLEREAMTYAGLLVISYSIAENAYRSGVLRTIIEERGLKDHELDIMWGLNKSCKKLCTDQEAFSDSETTVGAFAKQKELSQALLEFGKEYIGRWEMYNNLFED